MEWQTDHRALLAARADRRRWRLRSPRCARHALPRHDGAACERRHDAAQRRRCALGRHCVRDCERRVLDPLSRGSSPSRYPTATHSRCCACPSHLSVAHVLAEQRGALSSERARHGRRSLRDALQRHGSRYIPRFGGEVRAHNWRRGLWERGVDRRVTRRTAALLLAPELQCRAHRAQPRGSEAAGGATTQQGSCQRAGMRDSAGVTSSPPPAHSHSHANGATPRDVGLPLFVVHSSHRKLYAAAQTDSTVSELEQLEDERGRTS